MRNFLKRFWPLALVMLPLLIYRDGDCSGFAGADGHNLHTPDSSTRLATLSR